MSATLRAVALASATVLLGCPGSNKATQKPSIAFFTASPASITAGSSSTLSWSVSGATSLSIDSGVGTVTGTSTTVAPSATTTYTLIATNAGGSASASVTVTVTPPPLTISSFTATPSSIFPGASSTLAWIVSGAQSISIDHGVGTVTGASVAVSAMTTTTYTLTATATGGATATAQATLTVTAPVINSFSASPASITAGSSSTLSWSVSGAATLSIDQGLGPVTGTSISVSPAMDTTYKLTATNSVGSVTATTSVAVTIPPPAILSFTAAPNSILPGGTATLSWTTAHATSLSLDNGIGAVTGTSHAVSPAITTTYTLIASGAGTPATATATVRVLHLAYTDPPAGGLVRLVTHDASNPAHIVLDLVVGSTQQAFFGAALNFKLDTGKIAFNPGTGFDVSASALGPTASTETAAKALLPVSGPLAGTLVVGVAHRKRFPTDFDQTLAPGALIARFTFDLAPTATPGPIIDLGKSSGVLLNAALTQVAGLSDFAVGTLVVAE